MRRGHVRDLFVLARVRAGRDREVERGRRLCEKLLSYASPLQSYGEEIDADTGRHLGNFPQAFTHLALIDAVMHLIAAEGQASVVPASGPVAPGPSHPKPKGASAT